MAWFYEERVKAAVGKGVEVARDQLDDGTQVLTVQKEGPGAGDVRQELQAAELIPKGLGYIATQGGSELTPPLEITAGAEAGDDKHARDEIDFVSYILMATPDHKLTV